MSTEKLRVERDDRVLRAVINRPEKRNAIDLDIWNELWAVTREFAEDASLRVLQIAANGSYFSAGIDLHSPLAPDPAIKSPMAFRQWYRHGTGSLHGLADEWEAIGKPIVVAHQGPCLGGALELSLSADFRLASSKASYRLPEIMLGAIAGSGGTSRLVRLVGPAWARWIGLANKEVGADQAVAIGLAHQVFAEEHFQEAVDAFCRELADMPAEAFAAGKLAIELAVDLSRAEGRNLERLAVSGLVMGDEYKTMMSAMQARLAKKRD